MSLISEVLEKERNILRQVGHELTESNRDRDYPESYYNSYSENLYEPMGERHEKEYGGGSGGELNSSGKRPAKMASIRSSSAMTFNLLGNDAIVMKENRIGHTPGKYAIEYEKQLNTICNGKGQRPANLDALLVSENEDEPISDVFEGKSKVAYEKQVALEHDGFQKFCFALEKAGLLRGKTCFDVRYVSAKEFMSYFKIADGKMDYLRRYTLEG